MSFFPKDAEYVAMADAYGPECAACEGDDDAAHVDGCRWIATQEATPTPLDPDEVEELRIPVARMLTGDTLVAWATVEANEPPTVYVRRKKTAPEPDRVAFLHDYLTGRGDESLLDGLVVIDPAKVDLDALAKIWTETLAGGSNLTISPLGALWYEALRAVLAELGIEAAS